MNNNIGGILAEIDDLTGASADSEG